MQRPSELHTEATFPPQGVEAWAEEGESLFRRWQARDIDIDRVQLEWFRGEARERMGEDFVLEIRKYRCEC